MPFLSPTLVAQASRKLSNIGHEDLLGFLALKIEGLTTDAWIHITASNNIGPGLRLLAQQPPGFDDLVAANRAALKGNTAEGLPTDPTGRDTPGSTYTLYCPLTPKASYLLRKSDSQRSVIWTRMKEFKAGNNPGKATKQDIYETSELAPGNGMNIRLKPGYVWAAGWDLGPKGQMLSIPLRELALWIHRQDDLTDTTTIEQLVERTVERLNITREELDTLYYEDPSVSITTADFVAALDVEEVFKTLCLPTGGAVLPLSVEAPAVAIEKTRMLSNLERQRFDERSLILGLRTDMPDLIPDVATKDLLTDGHRNILLYGPPRTGKTHTARALAAHHLGIGVANLDTDPRFRSVQFHLGWGYGDFIRKLVPQVEPGVGLTFELQNGHLLGHCIKNPTGPSVFIIEELNRAALGQVLGEAFQVLEEGYRGTPVSLPASLVDADASDLTIPPDMLIIATANDVDRSTQGLDVALLERFATVKVPYQPSEVYMTLQRKGWTPKQAQDFVEMLKQIADVTGFPLGHATFYSDALKGPDTAKRFYHAKIRGVLDFYLSAFDKDKLQSVDALFENWDRARDTV